MKMEVLAMQQQYQSQYSIYRSNKVRDWTSPITPLMPLSSCACIDTESADALIAPDTDVAKKAQPQQQQQQTTATVSSSIPIPYPQNNTTNKMRNSITSKKSKRTASATEESNNGGSSSKTQARAAPNSNGSAAPMPTPAPASIGGSYLTSTPPQTNLLYCDDLDAAAVNDLSLRLLDELRAAKSRHLTCTEVSLPCDLTPRIAAEIIRVSEKEPCGIRGCTIYIEFEDEPNNSRRIASLKLDPEMVSTFEVYLTLRQDHRGWTALLPQFMKSLARTITISPAFTITKHKLYSPDRSSYSYGSYGSSSSSRTSAAISTPSS